MRGRLDLEAEEEEEDEERSGAGAEAEAASCARRRRRKMAFASRIARKECSWRTWIAPRGPKEMPRRARSVFWGVAQKWVVMCTL